MHFHGVFSHMHLPTQVFRRLIKAFSYKPLNWLESVDQQMICCWIPSHNLNCSMIEEERNFSHTDVCVFLVQQLLHYDPTFHPRLHQTHSHNHLHSYSSCTGSFVMCSPYVVKRHICFMYTHFLSTSDYVNL